jgi:hypothetical protein
VTNGLQATSEIVPLANPAKGLVGERLQTQRQDKPSGGRIPTVKAPPGRPGLTPPAAPKKRGKTPEQYAAESAAYRLAMRNHFAAIAAFNRERCVALGIKNYEWIAMDVHGTCDVARKNGGKVFSYTNPPPEGHVCEGLCNSPDWCRCIARSIVPGFD